MSRGSPTSGSRRPTSRTVPSRCRRRRRVASSPPLSGRPEGAAAEEQGGGWQGGAGTAMEVLAKFSHAVRKPTADPKRAVLYLTAINYANGALHGYAYEAVAADVIAPPCSGARFSSTGADEHGQVRTRRRRWG